MSLICHRDMAQPVFDKVVPANRCVWARWSGRLHAGVRVALEDKPPREVRGFGNPDARGFDNRWAGRGGEDFQSVSPQEIEPVAGAINPERLGQFSRAGTRRVGSTVFRRCRMSGIPRVGSRARMRTKPSSDPPLTRKFKSQWTP